MVYQALLHAAGELLNNVARLTEKAVDAGSPEQFAEAVEKLHKDDSEFYASARKMIEEDQTHSLEEKMALLKKLHEEELESRKHCVEILEGHQEKTGKFVLDVFQAFLTCGISLTPALIEKFKDAFEQKASDIPDVIVDDANVVDVETKDEDPEKSNETPPASDDDRN